MSVRATLKTGCHIKALQLADGAAPRAHVVKYLETPPSIEELRAILAKLEDEPAKLVRRDNWADLCITAEDVASPERVVVVLADHPELMERPLLVTSDRAFIGRPTERVSEFFGLI